MQTRQTQFVIKDFHTWLITGLISILIIVVGFFLAQSYSQLQEVVKSNAIIIRDQQQGKEQREKLYKALDKLGDQLDNIEYRVNRIEFKLKINSQLVNE